MCTRRPRQLALPVFIGLNVPRRSRPQSGDAPSHVSRSLRKQAHSKRRCRVRRHRKSTSSARRSPSSRTPGLKSDVGSGNFAPEGSKKQAWKLHGAALVTISSAYLAYAARSLTRRWAPYYPCSQRQNEGGMIRLLRHFQVEDEVLRSDRIARGSGRHHGYLRRSGRVGKNPARATA
jgi:hypothetical protein